MMKRWVAALVCVLLLLCGAHALAEEVSAAENRIESFTGAWPETLEAVMAQGEWAGARPLEGYVGMRFGRWHCGAALMQDAQGYILAGFEWTAEDGWRVTASRAALRQDERATLWNQALAEEWSAYDISQVDGSDVFEVVYADARYTWYCGSGGWFLNRVMLPVANVIVAPRTLYWNEESVFNTQDVTLENFVEAAFPRSLLEAQALVDAAGLDDATQALTTNGSTDEIVWQDFHVVMYAAPSDGTEVVAQYASGVAGAVLDIGSGYVKLQIGDMTGWVKRDQVLLGGERAAQYPWNGTTGAVYGGVTERYQPLLAAPREDAATVATLSINLRISVLGMLRGDQWLHVMLEDGTMGYMAADTVAQVDNFHTVWITSDKASNRLNLRESPTTKSQTLGKYYAGTEAVRLFSNTASNDWTRVIIHGRTGWMLNEFLSGGAGYAPDMLPPMGTVQGVETGGLNLRAAPDAKAEVLGQYANGTKVEILAVVGNWAHVRLRNGAAGFMMLKYLGGEPEGAIDNRFALAVDADLTEYYGTVLQHLDAGASVALTEGRPCTVWTYSEADAALVLEEPERVWVRCEDGSGFLPVAALALDW